MVPAERKSTRPMMAVEAISQIQAFALGLCMGGLVVLRAFHGLWAWRCRFDFRSVYFTAFGDARK
jgi:hypothetical protein